MKALSRMRTILRIVDPILREIPDSLNAYHLHRVTFARFRDGMSVIFTLRRVVHISFQITS